MTTIPTCPPLSAARSCEGKPIAESSCAGAASERALPQASSPGCATNATARVSWSTGVRCGLCHDPFSAHQGVEDDDMNVIALGARVIGPELAVELIRGFLRARFSGAERHRRRVEKIAALERSRS